MSLESIPTWFSDFFDITLGAAQVLLSIVVILAVLLPTLYLAKGYSNLIPIIILFLTEGFLVAIGWFPFWFLIATVVIIAFMFSRVATDGILGGS